MNNGYKQFFKTAQQVKAQPRPSFKVRTKSAAPSVDPDLKVRQALVRRVRKKTPTPWRAVAGLSMCLMALGFYMAAPEVCERWYRKIEISAFGQASAAAEKTATKPAPAEKAAASAGRKSQPKNPDETLTSGEEISHFEKLKQRKEELDVREKELSQLEEELQRQKVELDKRISQLEEMRGQIAAVLKERVEVDQEKVTKLVDLYSNMKPKQAAEVLGTINEDLAVEVLAKMKKKSAAEIMNLLPADKAKVLSEKYTGYRRAHGIEAKGS